MADNATEKAIDWSTTQGINLARVEAGSRDKAIAILNDLEGEIVKILDKNKTNIGKQQKLGLIQTEASKAVQAAYATMAAGNQQDLKAVAKTAAKGTAKQLNAGIGVSVVDPIISDKQLEKLASDTLIFGAKSGEWWAGQDQDLRDRFAKQMRMGYALGEGVDELTRRVRGTKANGFSDGLMATKRREAEALVRSSIQTISNAARIDQIKSMAPLVKAIRWTATLDSRTTDICKGLDGLVWSLPDFKPVGHSKQFPGPTAHWNCRSTQVPVTASWDELVGKPIKPLGDQELQDAIEKRLKDAGRPPEQIAQAKANARASMDGQVGKGQDYEAWLKTKPESFQIRVLGPSRQSIWKRGKLKLRDLTDQSNRPLTVKALENAIETDTLPPETEGMAPMIAATTVLTGNAIALSGIDSQAADLIQRLLDFPAMDPQLLSALRRVRKSNPGMPPAIQLATARGIVLEQRRSGK